MLIDHSCVLADDSINGEADIYKNVHKIKHLKRQRESSDSSDSSDYEPDDMHYLFFCNHF